MQSSVGFSGSENEADLESLRDRLRKMSNAELGRFIRAAEYVGRVEINHAGLAAFTGRKGKKRLGNLSWESLFERLAKKK